MRGSSRRLHVAGLLAGFFSAMSLSGCLFELAADAQPAPPAVKGAAKVRTARWVSESTRGNDGFTMQTDWYFRAEPFAIAWKSTIGRDTAHDVIDKRGHLHTASSWKDVSLYEEQRATYDEWIPKLYPWGPFTAKLNELAITPPARAGYEAKALELNGVRVPKYTYRFVERNHRVEVGYWLDPQTGRTLRTERIETDARSGKVDSREIERDFEYDVELPADAFDLPGKKPLRVEKIEGFPDVTKSLTKKDRTELERLILASEKAWIAGDFAAFQKSWHFPQRAHSVLPKPAQWKKWVSQQQGQWTGWKSKVESITKRDHVAVAVGTHSFSMMPYPNTLNVNVTTSVAWKGGRREVKSEYYLSKKGGAYHIVHWEYPSEELKEARR